VDVTAGLAEEMAGLTNAAAAPAAINSAKCRLEMGVLFISML
jgi:hypothetical protein